MDLSLTDNVRIYDIGELIICRSSFVFRNKTYQSDELDNIIAKYGSKKYIENSTKSSELGCIQLESNTCLYNIFPTHYDSNDHLFTLLMRIEEFHNIMVSFDIYKRKLFMDNSTRINHWGFIDNFIDRRYLDLIAIRKTIDVGEFKMLSSIYELIIDAYEFLNHITEYDRTPDYLFVQANDLMPTIHENYNLKSAICENGFLYEYYDNEIVYRMDPSTRIIERISNKPVYYSLCLYTKNDLVTIDPTTSLSIEIFIRGIVNFFEIHPPTKESSELLTSYKFPFIIQPIYNGQKIHMYVVEDAIYTYDSMGNEMSLQPYMYNNLMRFKSGTYIEAVLTSVSLRVIFYIHMTEINLKYGNLRSRIMNGTVINSMQDLILYKDYQYRVYPIHNSFVPGDVSLHIISPIYEVKPDLISNRRVSFTFENKNYQYILHDRVKVSSNCSIYLNKQGEDIVPFHIS